MTLTHSEIYLKDIRFHAYHGVGDAEHMVGNDYVVNVVACHDVTSAAASDDVADALNYVAVYDVVKQVMGEPRCLLESVAAEMARRLLDAFGGIAAVKIDLRKENPPIGADMQGAGVRICVERESAG